MKVLFAGPTLAAPVGPGEAALAAAEADAGFVRRGPARQGDVAAAVLAGAHAIGLVDGLYDNVAAVWHKEILFALSEGVSVFGAASLGALRAAECAAFGMIGIGAIYERYASGELDDDAAVAQVHAPAELGYLPLSEALVNVEATLAGVAADGLLADDETAALRAEAERLHFKERTYERLLAGLDHTGASRRREIEHLLATRKIDLKRRDAIDLVHQLLAAPDARRPKPSFRLARTGSFDEILRELSRSVSNALI